MSTWRKLIAEEKRDLVDEVTGPMDASLKSLAFQYARHELVAVHRACTTRGIVAVLSSSTQRSVRLTCGETWIEARLQDSVLFFQRAGTQPVAWSASEGIESFQGRFDRLLEQLVQDVVVNRPSP